MRFQVELGNEVVFTPPLFPSRNHCRPRALVETITHARLQVRKLRFVFALLFHAAQLTLFQPLSGETQSALQSLSGVQFEPSPQFQASDALVTVGGQLFRREPLQFPT